MEGPTKVWSGQAPLRYDLDSLLLIIIVVFGCPVRDHVKESKLDSGVKLFSWVLTLVWRNINSGASIFQIFNIDATFNESSMLMKNQ